MKYLKEYNSFISPEDQRINDLLDKGLDNLSDDEMTILKNQGEDSSQKIYVGIPDKMVFQLDKTEDFGDELKISGTLTYNDEEYYGWFTLPKSDEQRGKNDWDFFQGSMEFDPDPDDLYDLDSMIQELEFEYLK